MSRGLVALESYLVLSSAMLEAAQAQEWDELVRVGGERSVLFETLSPRLTGDLPSTEQAAARSIIERCQALDAQILALSEERQKALRVLLRVTAP